MKEQLCINNDKSIGLEEGFGNNEGTSDVEPMVKRTKKKCNLERFMMYTKLLMFFKALIFVLWLCGYVYRTYRDHTELEKIMIIENAKSQEDEYLLEMQDRLRVVKDW